MNRLAQIPRRYIVAAIAIVVEISLAAIWLVVRRTRAVAPAA
jgi:hypothetical protein